MAEITAFEVCWDLEIEVVGLVEIWCGKSWDVESKVLKKLDVESKV